MRTHAVLYNHGMAKIVIKTNLLEKLPTYRSLHIMRNRKGKITSKESYRKTNHRKKKSKKERVNIATTSQEGNVTERKNHGRSAATKIEFTERKIQSLKEKVRDEEFGDGG